jgi:hypothetical protein
VIKSSAGYLIMQNHSGLTGERSLIFRNLLDLAISHA